MEKIERGEVQWHLPRATKSGALDALRRRIALAITCNEMPEVNWTIENPALLLMLRLWEILVDGLGK